MYISFFKNIFRYNRFSYFQLSSFSSNKNPDPSAAVKKFLKDDEILLDRVRVLKDKKLLGDYTIFEARMLAKSQNLNLILFRPNSDPPVCVIDNYNEFVKSLAKKETKKEPETYTFDPSLKSKTVQISENCATPDLNRKLSSVRKFLLSGQRVDVVISTNYRKNKDSGKHSGSGDASPDPENTLLQKIDFIYNRLADISNPYTMKNKVNMNSRQILLKFWPK